MAQDLFRRLLFTVIIITAFAFLSINFARTILTDNDLDPTTDLAGGNDLGYSNFGAEVDNYSSTETGWTTSFLAKDEESADEGPTLLGMFGTLSNIGEFVTGPFRALNQLATDVLHVPAGVIATVALLISLVVIFGIWRTIKVGD